MMRVFTKNILLLALAIMCISIVKAQEPITIKVSYRGERSQVSKELASAVFINEQGKIAVPDRTQSSVYTMNVAEKYIPQIILPVIQVFFVNNAGIVSPHFSKGDTLTLDVYPFRNGIFYCKSYTLQNESQVRAMQQYNSIEKDIIGFLEHAEQGDTLKQPMVLVDSRYTPLLIKNLSNNNEVFIEQIMHGDGVKYTKFLGIVIKKERVGYTVIDYQNMRMSDFARARLKEIFRPIYWSFDFPDAKASAEEWQVWFDKLLNPTSYIIAN